MVLNCKVCGGDLKIIEGSAICKCEYCGKEQTLPKVDDDLMANMFNRANHFRQIFEFDKAIEIYERLLNNGCEDAELYWSLALCRYGIEYVDDPLTREKIPTCHRTQFTSILEDADYLIAVKNADPSQRFLFEREANYIDKVQKDILEISNKEAPFDVFICYKESDGVGTRTKDSVLAQDIYYQLTSKGYKVFFSRITLENKVGQQYEPYIFAALNSAKVMIVVGTKPEFFNAVWVKNEWNRFLALAHEDKSRLIIPAFKDMDPYDLPDALSYYQALDMSKIGFVQDLVRGIEKVLNDAKDNDNSSVENSASAVSSNVTALLKRGYFALEDGEWDLALKFFDQVLNNDAENGEAYFGMGLAYMKASSLDAVVRSRIELFHSKLPEMAESQLLYVTQEQMERLEVFLGLSDTEAVKQYVANCKHPYVTSVKKIEAYIRSEEGYFDNNKYFNKGVRFSETVKKSISEAKNTVLADMQQTLEDAKENEAQSKAEARKRVDVLYQKVEIYFSRRHDEFEERYQALVAEYNGGKYYTSELLEKFKKLSAFKDSKDYVKKLTEEKAANALRIEKLVNDRRELWNEHARYNGVGSAKRLKREELERKMREVDEEIQRLS